MTIRDVADYCGVSVSTVSRVLNDRPDVSEKIRSEVMKAVKELHYVPNSSARDLGKSRSDSIGLVVRGAGNPFFTTVLRSIEASASKAGYSVILSQVSEDGDELAQGASLARSRRLQGLIFLGGRFDYSTMDTIKLGVPYVCCTFTNNFGNLRKDTYSSVSIDDRREAEEAVSYLIRNGHRKIAIILGKKDDLSIGHLRYDGYRDALEKAGIPFDEELVQEVGAYDMAAAYEGTRKLMERRGDVTAIFVIADSLAMAVLKGLNDAGRKVPGDCSVISIDGIGFSNYTVPTLTTLEQPDAELGQKAVEILLDVIENKGENRQILLTTRLRQGGTVAEITA